MFKGSPRRLQVKKLRGTRVEQERSESVDSSSSVADRKFEAIVKNDDAKYQEALGSALNSALMDCVLDADSQAKEEDRAKKAKAQRKRRQASGKASARNRTDRERGWATRLAGSGDESTSDDAAERASKPVKKGGGVRKSTGGAGGGAASSSAKAIANADGPVPIADADASAGGAATGMGDDGVAAQGRGRGRPSEFDVRKKELWQQFNGPLSDSLMWTSNQAAYDLKLRQVVRWSNTARQKRQSSKGDAVPLLDLEVKKFSMMEQGLKMSAMAAALTAPAPNVPDDLLSCCKLLVSFLFA